MKKSFLWVWVILFLATATNQMMGQNPVTVRDSIPAYSTIKGLVPDCNKYGEGFFVYRNGEWVANKGSGSSYAELFAYIGEGEFTPEQAIDFVKQSLSNPLQRNLNGYIGAVCWDGKKWCVSFSGRLTSFDGKFLCRVNSEWSLYTRNGCKNPALVYDPQKEDLVPKGVVVTVRDTIRDTVRIQTPPTIVNCQNCCPGDSLRFEEEAAAVFTYERTAGDLEKWFGLYYEWQAYKLHRNDKLEPWMERLLSYYGGFNALIGEKGVPFSPTCDTCGYWGPIPGGLAFKSEVYFGVQHRIFKKYDVFGFWEMRYAWLNTRHIRNKFLSDEGIGSRIGFRILFDLPKDFPIFREIKGDIGFQLKTHAPTSELRLGGGGFVQIAVVMGPRDAEVLLERDSLRRVQASQQFLRDSTARIQKDSLQFVRDSTEIADFFENNPQPIQIDSVSLEPDYSVYDSVVVPKKLLGITLPFTKAAKKARLLEAKKSVNRFKVYVLDLQNEQNQLRLNVQFGDKSMYSALQTNIENLEEAQQNLQRAERRVSRLEE